MSLAFAEGSTVSEKLAGNENRHKSSRRQRPVIVCTNCRRRKIKCDKNKPCSNCVLSKLSDNCKYDTPVKRKAEDEFTMQLQLDYSGTIGNRPLLSPGNLISSFSVESMSETETSKGPFKKKQKADVGVADSPESNTTPNTTTTITSNTTTSSQQKSEIQILKERLEQIEKSISESSLRPIEARSNNYNIPASSGLPNRVPSYDKFSNIHMTPSFPKRISAIEQYPSMNTVSRVPPPPENLYGPVMPQLGTGFSHTPNSVPNVEYTQTKHHSALQGFGSENSNVFGLNSSTSISKPVSTKYDQSRKEKLLIGVNIVGKVNDTISFYDHYSTLHYKDDLRRINYGPFAWSSLMRRDHGLQIVWEHVKLKKENSIALVFTGSTSEESVDTILNSGKYGDTNEEDFQKRALENDGIDEILPYSSILHARKERQTQKKNSDFGNLSLGLTFYDDIIKRQLDTIERIKAVLPSKRIIWKLIKRFFEAVYLYMPFLDEESYREDLVRVLGPMSWEDEPVDLKIDRKLDLATVGILLTILRLSYLSLLSNNTELTESILKSNDSTKEIQLMKYLLSNPISIDTIKVASLCLEQFEYMRRTNFTVMQLALYLRIYHTYAPEDGDGADGGDSQVLGAILLQMAYQLGLNREPSLTSNNLKMNNLIRKIWQFISLSDIYLAFCFGNPLSVDTRYSDTKRAFNVPGGENLIDKSLDNSIASRFNSCASLFCDLKDTLRDILDVNNRINLSTLTTKLAAIEDEWYISQGSLKDCLEFTCSVEGSVADRNFRVKLYLGLKGFLLTIYFHIFLYYESIDIDVAFFYFKKCILISTVDIMPYYSSLLRNSENVSDMIVNPTLEMFVHKANLVYLSGIIRVNFRIHHLRLQKDHFHQINNDPVYLGYFQKLCQFSSCLTRAAEYTISAISKISNRYYYAWRITKSQMVLLKNVTSPEFFAANYAQSYKLYQARYSESQYQELISLCDCTLAMFDNSEFKTFGFARQADYQLSNMSNVSSNSITPPDGATDSEIDKLWLQILSWKHDMQTTHNEGQSEAFTPTINNISDSKSGKLPGNLADLSEQGQAFSIDPSLPTKLDIFSDMPFNDNCDCWS